MGNELSLLAILSSIIMMTGIMVQSFLVIFVGLLFLLFIYVNRFYLNRVGEHISVEINKETIKLFKGENDDFSITFSQNGVIPLFNAQVRITIDSMIEFENERQILETEQIELHLPLSLMGRQSVTTRLPFYARKRGVVKIRTLEVRIPHLFGFGEVYLQYTKPLLFETIIFSSPVVVGGIEKIIPKNQGEYPIKSSYFEDLNAIVGARQYVSTDPFNRVHWKASARTNELQTKMFDKTAQFSWTIMINVRERNLEDYLSGLTYLLEYATLKNIPFEVFVNIRKAGKSPFVHQALGTGKEHLARALELIARLSKHSITVPFHFMIHAAGRQHVLSPFVILSGDIDQNEHLLLKQFAQKGIDSFKILENDHNIYLIKTSQYEREVNSHAI
ncbi:DUF58 domain-containing protein [Fredinandcohnia sp. SECRCQ15]|uniref:DUF58 domain-containing protein n=1 Tax=Fredinandcohnia quinoae TaxID=2918902 RepID=A0AAW5E3Q3_9BACI|nr:DUF58 domain-containing protein [Fredinandcohnia sp. SECRCQ15]